jgi:hypothetical protein
LYYLDPFILSIYCDSTNFSKILTKRRKRTLRVSDFPIYVRRKWLLSNMAVLNRSYDLLCALNPIVSTMINISSESGFGRAIISKRVLFFDFNPNSFAWLKHFAPLRKYTIQTIIRISIMVTSISLAPNGNCNIGKTAKNTLDPYNFGKVLVLK